jgi:hypothetical protein
MVDDGFSISKSLLNDSRYRDSLATIGRITYLGLNEEEQSEKNDENQPISNPRPNQVLPRPNEEPDESQEEFQDAPEPVEEFQDAPEPVEEFQDAPEPDEEFYDAQEPDEELFANRVGLWGPTETARKSEYLPPQRGNIRPGTKGKYAQSLINDPEVFPYLEEPDETLFANKGHSWGPTETVIKGSKLKIPSKKPGKTAIAKRPQSLINDPEVFPEYEEEPEEYESHTGKYKIDQPFLNPAYENPVYESDPEEFDLNEDMFKDKPKRKGKEKAVLEEPFRGNLFDEEGLNPNFDDLVAGDAELEELPYIKPDIRLQSEDIYNVPDDIVLTISKLRTFDKVNKYMKMHNIPKRTVGKKGNPTIASMKNDIYQFYASTKQTTGTGFRRPLQQPKKSIESLIDFGDYMINSNDLNHDTLKLYNYDNKVVLNQHISKPIRYVLKDLISGEYAINEDLTDAEYHKLKQILTFVNMPNPAIHERRARAPQKSDLLSLKRRFEILTGEYNAGNNNLGPQLVSIIKQMHQRGLINKRLADEGIKTYKSAIIY